MGDNDGSTVDSGANTMPAKKTSWLDDLMEAARARFKPLRQRNKDIELIAQGKDIGDE
jgi:hypothetical protein